MAVRKTLPSDTASGSVAFGSVAVAVTLPLTGIPYAFTVVGAANGIAVTPAIAAAKVS